jgi:hypothetical protein
VASTATGGTAGITSERLHVTTPDMNESSRGMRRRACGCMSQAFASSLACICMVRCSIIGPVAGGNNGGNVQGLISDARQLRNEYWSWPSSECNINAHKHVSGRGTVTLVCIGASMSTRSHAGQPACTFCMTPHVHVVYGGCSHVPRQPVVCIARLTVSGHLKQHSTTPL